MQFLINLFDKANEFLVAQMGDLGPLIAAGGLGVLLVLIALPSMLFKKRTRSTVSRTCGWAMT